MRTEEKKRKGEQVEAGKACEKERERGKEDSISFKKKKERKRNGRNVVKYVEDWVSEEALQDLMLKSGKKNWKLKVWFE